ncbi:MAG TPA: DUF4249 domain-containing protein [Cytophagaceae bacterium]
MRYFNIILVILFASPLLSCEDVVPVDITPSAAQLAVDGDITTSVQPDTVRLMMTVPYLDNSRNIPFVNDALVVIEEKESSLSDTLRSIGDGNYITTKLRGKINRNYILTIEYQGEKYTAETTIKRVARIDSVLTDYREESEFGRKPGYYIDLLANDLPGIGDCYRLKVYRNGILYNRPNDLNLAYDASFSKGGSTDGTRFIFPIRESLNPSSTTNEDNPPFELNDKVRVEITSLTEDHFEFYRSLRDELNNGGLFATPPANLKTNIKNVNRSSEKQAVGWFGGSAISSMEITITKP